MVSKGLGLFKINSYQLVNVFRMISSAQAQKPQPEMMKSTKNRIFDEV